MLNEELVDAEAIEIQKEIIKRIGKSKDINFDITDLFSKRKETIEKEDIQIHFYFNNEKGRKHSAFATYLTKEEVANQLNLPLEEVSPVIQVVIFGEDRNYLLNKAIFHEIIHTIDLLKIGGKKSKMRKSYINVMSKRNNLPKDFLTPYLTNNLEYNQLINNAMNKYNNNKSFKNKIDSVKTYYDLLELILGKDKFDLAHISKDNAFKKRILGRLVKEGAKLNLTGETETFTDKVKKWLSSQ